VKRIVVLSDIQYPFHNSRALKAVIRFVGEYRPDHLVQIGDFMDYPQPSRWSKDTALEYQGSVFEDSRKAQRDVLKEMRKVYDGPFGIIEGNHDLRPRQYLAKYAPALAESRAFDLDVLLAFEDYGVEKLPDFWEFAPGWIMTHGHLGGIRLTNEAGRTALNAAKRIGKSVVMGHTHRMGICKFTFGYNARITQELTGVEVGHLMDMKKAGYLKGSTANWQMGFAIIHIEGSYVKPELIPITKNKFVVDGTVFSV